MTSTLARTRNLLILYTHHVGQSEVPAVYHYYCGLALLAACAADRVWYVKRPGFRLTPNLYTFLLGPSAIGKGDAIDEALKFVIGDTPAAKRVHLYAGDATAPALLRHMAWTPKGWPPGTTGPHARVLFVTPELGMSLGRGEKAESLIKTTTEMFNGRPYPLSKATVTRGEATLVGYQLNWLAGTTVRWLHDSIPHDSITGGFWGRVLPVTADYDLSVRFYRPIPPPDRDAVVAYLHEQLEALTWVEGEMHLTPQAAFVERRWYEYRPDAPTEDQVPTWKRGHDLLLKLCMLFSLADGPSLEINEEHVHMAQDVIRVAERGLPAIIASASTTPETVGVERVSRLIQGWGRVSQQHLLATVYREMTETKLREIVQTLVGAGKVRRVAGAAGPGLQWAERRRGWGTQVLQGEDQ